MISTARRTSRPSKTTMILLSDIGFDQKYYPRNAGDADWVTVYRYLEALRANRSYQFPEIVLVSSPSKEYKFLIIDGLHRFQSYHRAKRDRIPAIVEHLPESRWFARAVELNRSHGRSFTTQDKAFIAARLDRDGWSENEQARLLQMPLESLKRIKVERLVPVVTKSGKQGAPTAEPLILKAPAKNLTGRAAERAAKYQSPLAAPDVRHVLDQMIAVLEMGLVNIADPEVGERIERIKTLLP